MKKVIMYITSDGVVHKGKLEAKKHLERVYGDLLLSISHKLVKCEDKYMNFANFVDTELKSFTQLAKIKADFDLEEDEDPEDN